MTAWNPETDSGTRGRTGSQATRPVPEVVPWTRRVISYPYASKERCNAAPTKPEDPLSKILAGMQQLYQPCQSVAEDMRSVKVSGIYNLTTMQFRFRSR